MCKYYRNPMNILFLYAKWNSSALLNIGSLSKKASKSISSGKDIINIYFLPFGYYCYKFSRAIRHYLNEVSNFVALPDGPSNNDSRSR